MYALAEENVDHSQEGKYYRQAYHSYLLMYDANNIAERKRLLKNIVKDPYVCVLFLTNCKPNDEEKNLVLETIIDDARCSFLTLNILGLNDPKRDELFITVLNDSQYAYESSKNSLQPHEKQLVYQLYKNTFFDVNQTIGKYFEAYTIFREYIGFKITKRLVDKIYNERNCYFAESLLQFTKLPEVLKDKLESLLVIENLNN